jgi:FG-GAP-like repeat
MLRTLRDARARRTEPSSRKVAVPMRLAAAAAYVASASAATAWGVAACGARTDLTDPPVAALVVDAAVRPAREAGARCKWSFAPQTTFTVGVGPEALTVGDFNDDGHLDLAVANVASGTVSVLLGSGSGTFGAQSSFVVGNVPGSVAMGDVNGDGYLDLAVANYDSGGGNTVSILLGMGTGSFGPQTTWSSPDRVDGHTMLPSSRSSRS